MWKQLFVVLVESMDLLRVIIFVIVFFQSIVFIQYQILIVLFECMQKGEKILISKMCYMKVYPKLHPMLLTWKMKNDFHI